MSRIHRSAQTDGRRIYLVAALLAFVFAAPACAGDETEATTLPGLVEQSASASANGFTVASHRATFAGTSVDLHLVITADDPDIRPAGIQPADAILAGHPAESARPGASNGATALRFPPESWPPTGDTAELVIQAVQVLGEGAPFERIQVDMRLPVALPTGDDAEAARLVRAFPMQVVELDEVRDLTVQAYSTDAETVVEYWTPPDVSAVGMPSIRVRGERIWPEHLEQVSETAPAVAWFGPVAKGVPLTVVFDGLRVPDPTSDGWTVRIAFDPFDPTSIDLDDPPAPVPLDWSPLPGSDGPAVLGVEWLRFRSPRQPEGYGTEIHVWVEGIHDPGTPTFGPPGLQTNAPALVADGKALRVTSLGARYNDTEGVPRTVIHGDLGLSDVPAVLEVRMPAETIALNPVEVTLEP